MRSIRFVVVGLCMLAGIFAAAKDKKRVLLPADVLRAQTVLVVVDPQAGIVIDAPNANRAARDAVEQELMKWGRFQIATDVSTADLVITVRKGNGKTVQPTIGGIPQNDRPVIFQPSESGGRIGGTHGTPSMSGDPTAPQYPHPAPRVEAGPAEDIFAVYRGKRDNALESSPVWRYIAKGSLDTPHVKAVEEFRKLIVEAEKQEANSN